MGSGTTGTVAVWTNASGGNTIGSTSSISGTASASLFITGPGPWIDVTTFGAVADSTTDNAAAIQNAINACPLSSATMTSAGCTVFFPYSGTGNYLIKSSIKVNTGGTLQDGVRLVGECTALGSGSLRPSSSPAPLTCSTIVANSSFTSTDAMLVVGSATVKTHGFVLQDLGFSDTSANNSAVPGAIHIVEIEDFNLVNPRCVNLAASPPNGYCMQFDGGSDFTQFGTVITPSVERVRYPIITNGNTSEVNVYGGELDCSGPSGNPISGSIGLNLGATHNPPAMGSNGEWGIYGTHVLNCATGLSGFQANVLQWYGIAEIPTGVTTTNNVGISLTGSGSAGNGGGGTIAGSINNYNTGVQLVLTTPATSAPPDVRITASITPNGTNGVALSIDPTVIGSTLILTPENYSGGVGTSGTASGSAFGSDVVVSSVNNPRALLTTIPNGTSSGTQTVVNKLAKLSGGTAVITSTSDTQGALGIVVNGAGTSGSAQIAAIGQAMCAFDGATAAGDFVTISQSTQGDCHDYGASGGVTGPYPPTGQVLGRVLSTNAAGGTYPVSVSGTEQVAPAPQVRNSVTLTDDFFAASTSSGTIGELGWSISTAGTGTSVVGKIAGAANHPGLLQRTSTATNQIAELYLGSSTNSLLPLATLNGVAFRATFIFRIESPLSNITARIGFTDDAGGNPPSDGIYFETTAASWTGVTRAASTSSTTSGMSALNNSFHTFQIVNDGANNVSFYDGDTLLGTLTTNIPSGSTALVPFFDIQSTNATTKTLDVDTFQFTMSVTR
jgi:Pectate lyase superfamily protein